MERKDKIIFIFAIVIAALPFLGLPGAFESVLYTLLGLSIAVLVYVRRVRVKETKSKSDVFTENAEDFVDKEKEGK